jgi:hypothetical protein
MKTKQILRVLAGSLFAMLVAVMMGACPQPTGTGGGPETPVPTVTGVTVTPDTADVDQGKTQQFTAVVAGTNNPSQSVTWGVTGNSDGTTSITDGLLSVGSNETVGGTLTVTATSTADTTKVGTAAVLVWVESDDPVVRSVTVSSAAQQVEKGKTQQFTVNVNVSGPEYNLPPTTVTWAIAEANKNPGTTISESGLLTVGVDETLTALTITATSTFDTTKVGTATVTVVNAFVGFSGTKWTDGLLPESTLDFTSVSSVTLEGRYWSQHNGPNKIGDTVHPYEVANDLTGAVVEPAIWVILNTGNRTGFELYYYQAAHGKNRHLVAYVNGLQPREFYMVGESPSIPNIPNPPGIIDGANPALSALVSYFNSTAIDVTVAAGYGAPTVTAPTLTTGVTSLVSNKRITGALTYTTLADGGPKITYKITVDDRNTLDVHSFSQGEGDQLAAAISGSLGIVSGTYTDITAGYRFFGTVTAAPTVFPDAGSIAIIIPLVQDTVAPGIITDINGAGAITAVTITGSTAAITGDLTYSASYVSASKTLQVTVPAADISASGATAVARALLTAVNGKITTDDAGYTLPVSATGAISGANVVASIVLQKGAVPAATITAAITPADGALSIASGGVTGDVITALNGVANATNTATAAYNSTRHEVSITVTPTANYVFSTATGFYNTVATALNTKFTGKVTNSVESTYSTVSSTTYAVTGGNLVFTVAFSNFIDAATITAALNGVGANSSATIASGNVTGDVLTALVNIPGATAGVTTTYTTANHTLTIRVAPAASFTFNPGLVAQGQNVVSPYASVGTAIVAKLGATVINNVNATYTSVKPSVGIEVSGGNLVFTVQLATVLQASQLVSRITGAANGNLNVTGVMNASYGTDWGVSGALIDALGPPLVTATGGYNETTGAITISLAPGPEYVFGTAAADYAGVATALNNKPIGTIVNTDKKGNITIREATGVTHALTNGNLVLTIGSRQPEVAAASIVTAINGAADGSIAVAGATSITGAIITALTEIPQATTTVGTAYNTAGHAITLTIAPVAGKIYNTTGGYYSTVADALGTKLGAVTNAVDEEYVKAGTPTAAVTDGNLVVTIPLGLAQAIEASVLADAISGAANGNIVIELVEVTIDTDYGPYTFEVEVPTGSIVTALNDLGATGDLLATKRGTAGWDFAIPPAAGSFSTEAGAYSSVAAALQTKLAGGAFKALSGTVVTVSGVTASVTEGNLVLSINFITSTIGAASLTTAINGVANGDSVVIDNKGNITMTGPVNNVVTALTATSEIASVTVVGIQDAPGGYNFYLIPADGFSYAPAATTYSGVATALKTKLSSGTFTTDVTSYDWGTYQEVQSIDERTIGTVQAIIAAPDDMNAGGPGTVVIQVFYATP